MPELRKSYSLYSTEIIDKFSHRERGDDHQFLGRFNQCKVMGKIYFIYICTLRVDAGLYTNDTHV